MAVTIKNLGAGNIANTTAVSKGPGTGKSWIVKSIVLTNLDTNLRTMDIKFVTAATAYYVAPKAMSISASSTALLDYEITLQNPSGGPAETVSIAALSGTGTITVDYVLNGIERDL